MNLSLTDQRWRLCGLGPVASGSDPKGRGWIDGYRTVFDEKVAALEQFFAGSILVGEEAEDDGAVEGDASPRRNLTAVSAAKRSVDQIDRYRVGDLRVQVDVLVAAPVNANFNFTLSSTHSAAGSSRSRDSNYGPFE